MDEALAKGPEVTLAFWIIKILATTLGETAGCIFAFPHRAARRAH